MRVEQHILVDFLFNVDIIRNKIHISFRPTAAIHPPVMVVVRRFRNLSS